MALAVDVRENGANRNDYNTISGNKIVTQTDSWRDKDWLYDHYWRQEKTLSEIATELGYSSRQTIANEMSNQGIPTRRYSAKTGDGYIVARLSRSWFYEKYWRQEKSLEQIAGENNVSPETVRYRMEQLGVPRATNGGVNVHIMYMRGRNWLFDEYWRKGKTCHEIDDENSVCRGTTQSLMTRMDPEIIRRPSGIPPNEYVTRYLDAGYVCLYDTPDVQVREHRLAAIAEYGYDAVAGNHVHHANKIPWLNVPVFGIDIPELENPNLVPMDPITHARIK